jgi:hypothetical protein
MPGSYGATVSFPLRVKRIFGIVDFVTVQIVTSAVAAALPRGLKSPLYDSRPGPDA